MKLLTASRSLDLRWGCWEGGGLCFSGGESKTIPGNTQTTESSDGPPKPTGVLGVDKQALPPLCLGLTRPLGSLCWVWCGQSLGQREGGGRESEIWWGYKELFSDQAHYHVWWSKHPCVQGHPGQILIFKSNSQVSYQMRNPARQWVIRVSVVSWLVLCRSSISFQLPSLSLSFCLPPLFHASRLSGLLSKLKGTLKCIGNLDLLLWHQTLGLGWSAP